MIRLSVENWINIISIVVSTTISIASIFIAIKTLKITSKSIYDSNKPYITVFIERINVVSTPNFYLVIKNFGKTGAKILEINFDSKFDKNLYFDKEPFKYLQNTFIAPNQSFTYALENKKSDFSCICKIIYEYNNEILQTEIPLNFSFHTNYNHSIALPTSKAKLEDIIVRSTTETIRKNF